MSEKWKKGEVIDDRYTIHDIKKGGMGIVFICFDNNEKRIVVIKTYQDRFIKDNTSIERFMSEATTWVRLGKHKNIVNAYYVPLYMFRPYIIMEYVAGHEVYGSDLDTWMARRRLPFITILDFAIQFCSGMIYAESIFTSYSKSFIHRDIKPSNILINSDAVIKITDFGISRSLSEKDTGIGWGTPKYMSPEQIDDPAHVDIRSDIYSFGCVLSEMARYLDPNNYKSLFSLIHTSFEKNPQNRYQNFSVLKKDLLTIYLTSMGQNYKEPADIEPEKENKKELIEKAVSFINLGRTTDAIQCLNQSLSIEGSSELDYKAFCSRGLAMVDMNQMDEALADYAKAIRIFPNSPFAYTMRANIFNNSGKLLEALEYYNKSIELDPEYGIAHYNRGLCHMRIGQLDEAINDFNYAINLGYSEAFCNRGGIYLKKQKYEEALADFKMAIEFNPRDAVSYCNIGIIYEYYNKFEEALKYYNLSIQVNPYYLAAYYNRGMMFCKTLKLPEEAIGDFENILSIDPKECENLSGGFISLTDQELNDIYYNTNRACGISYYVLEQWDKAKCYLIKYLEFPALKKDSSSIIEGISNIVLWLKINK